MAAPPASTMFAGNQRLRDCSQKNSFHIVPGERGPHVQLIQNALVSLLYHTVLSETEQRALDKEVEQSFYGPRTAKVVVHYKRSQTPMLLGPGQTVPDNIVGIRTISKLDDDVKAFDPEPEPDPCDILIFFSGVQTPGGSELKDPPNSSAFLMCRPMKAMAEGRKNAKFLAIGGALQAGEATNGISLAKNFLIDNVTPNPGRHVVYGYSAGGTNSLALTRELDDLNAERKTKGLQKISIHLLVTVDAADRRDMPLKVERKVGGCVYVNWNYFQLSPSANPWSGAHGGRNVGLKDSEGREATLHNRDLSWECSFLLDPGHSQHAQVEKISLERCKKHIQRSLDGHDE